MHKNKNLLEWIDAAVNPKLNARAVAARAAALAEKLRKVPSPTHEAYVKICERLQFSLPAELNEAIRSLKAAWLAAYQVAVDHGHDKVWPAFHAHEADLQAAASDPEKLRGLNVRTVEDFRAEYLAKLKNANKECQRIMGEIVKVIQPVREDFATDIEWLAEKIESDDETLASSLGLDYHEQSPVVLQLRKAVFDIRNSPAYINPLSNADAASAADFCAAK